MKFLELVKKRYSVHSYTEQKVEKEKLDSIIEAAHVAPTGANCQPQHLIVVQSDTGLSKIGKAANIYDAPLYPRRYRRVAGCLHKLWSRYVDVRLERKQEVLETYHAAVHPTLKQAGVKEPDRARPAQKKKSHKMER